VVEYIKVFGHAGFLCITGQRRGTSRLRGAGELIGYGNLEHEWPRPATLEPPALRCCSKTAKAVTKHGKIQI
jgi:hypothetical protein